MQIEEFIRCAHDALATGSVLDQSTAAKSIEAMNQSLQNHQCPDSFIASWILLELSDRNLLPRNEQPRLLDAELIATLIATGSPIKDACGELYWAWGEHATEEEWRQPGANPELDNCSDHDALLLRFKENADHVLPAMRRAKDLGLKVEYLDDFATCEETVSRIAESGDATAYDNDLLCIYLMSSHARLIQLVEEQHTVVMTEGMENREKDTTFSKLLKWPTVAADEIAPYVAALSSFRAVERRQYELVKPLMLALKEWERQTYSHWVSQIMRHVIEKSSPADYELFVKSLPPKLEEMSKAKPRHRQMSVEMRRAVATWYKSADGTQRKHRVDRLFEIAENCAETLGINKRPISLTEEHLSFLSESDRSSLENAINKLGADWAQHWRDILKMKTARKATLATRFYEIQLTNWDMTDVENYIRYLYR